MQPICILNSMMLCSVKVSPTISVSLEVGEAQGMSSYTCKLRTILSYLRVLISPK